MLAAHLDAPLRITSKNKAAFLKPPVPQGETTHSAGFFFITSDTNYA
jgi:hypothetical protein